LELEEGQRNVVVVGSAREIAGERLNAGEGWCTKGKKIACKDEREKVDREREFLVRENRSEKNAPSQIFSKENDIYVCMREAILALGSIQGL